MTTERAEAAFTVTARDRFTPTIARLEKQVVSLGRRFMGLAGNLLRLVAIFGLFKAAMVGLAAIIPAIITIQTITGMLRFEQAARRARFQLRIMGLSAAEARNAIASMSKVMDRATAVSIFGSAEAMTTAAVAGLNLTKELLPLAEKLAEIAQVPVPAMFQALFAIVTEDNLKPFMELVAGAEDFGMVMDALIAGDLPGFWREVGRAIEEDVVPIVQKLADNLARLPELTKVEREAVSAGVATFLNIWVSSLAEHLETLKENIKTIFVGGLGAAAALAGKPVALRFAGGFVGALAVALILDVERTFQTAMENPELIVAIAIAAGTLGTLVGQRFMVAFLIATVALLPGLADTFEDLDLMDMVLIAATGLGLIVGRRLRWGIFRGLLLAVLLVDVISDLFSGADITHKGLRLAAAGLGAAVGAIFGGAFGAVVGAYLAVTLFDELEKRGWVAKWEQIAFKIGDAFIWVFNHVRDVILGIVNFILRNVEQLVRAIRPFANLIPGVNIPEVTISPITQPKEQATFQDLSAAMAEAATSAAAQAIRAASTFQPAPGQTLFPEFAKFGFAFQRGGVVPGPRGAPRMAMVHGGETILPTHRGPMVIQLIMDRKVIGEASLEAFQRTARLKAGMVTGSLGS